MKKVQSVAGLLLTVACGRGSSITPPPPPPPAVASVTITAARTTLAVNDVLALTFEEKDAQGKALTGRAVTWLSTAPTVASVTQSGILTALAPGSATIRATSEGVTGSLGFTVKDTGGTTDPLLVQRLVAQQGLAIALISTTLQSQLGVSTFARTTDFSCQTQYGGISIRKTAGDTLPPFDLSVYYDSTCTRRYLSEHVTTYDLGETGVHMIATASYFGPTGTLLGTTTYDERAMFPTATTGLALYGLGTFTPANGGPGVSLGLSCALGGGPGVLLSLPCQAGVAQNLPAFAIAIGSVTTAQLVVDTLGVVSFNGASTLRSAELNGLALAVPQPSALTILGGVSRGTTTASGSEAVFTLFPPMPTGWSVTDSAHDQRFTINLVSNEVRNLTGTISRISTGATLATIGVDQSGTGTITYSDGTVAAVTSWTLSK